ncbi:MAG: hypothetical protein HY909_24980 [Deltaproteobacteria bacterium]|nr:hypothetical protein [Deltaproteobacteria bacterium]
MRRALAPWLCLALAACAGRSPAPSGAEQRAATSGGENAPSVQSTASAGAPASTGEEPDAQPTAPVAPATPAVLDPNVDAVALHERELTGGQQQLLGATECRDICRASAQICTAAGMICRLTGGAAEAPHPRCERARRACSDATAQRDGSCAVCPAW